MKRRKGKNFIILLAMGVILVVGGVMAYFTSTDKTSNKFSIGEVKIKLEEPSWVEPADITPNKTIAQDPQISNIGINDAYVFLKVVIPKANVEIAEQDGTKSGKAIHQLFQLNNIANKNAKWNETDTINSGWVQVGERETTADDDGYVYIFAYGTNDECTILEKNTITSTPLFSSVSFINAIEGQDLEKGIKDISVEAFGIQTENIGTNNKKSPTDVWTVLSKQTE